MPEKLPLNPNVELFRWGPAMMRFYFNSDFEGILTRFPLVFPGEYWPHGLFISCGRNMVWVGEYSEVRKCGLSVFLHYMLDKSGRKKVWRGWLKDLRALQVWEKKIDAVKNLSKLSQKDFMGLWVEMKEVLLKFWTNILVPEMGNYGADKLLEEKLKEFIKNDGQVASAMEVLTSPEKPSFFQQEEIDLSRTDNFVKHASEYFWLRNSYNGTEILPVSFFEKRKMELGSDIEKNFKKRKEKVRRNKLEVIKRYQLSKEVVDIADAFVHGVEWQDSRKAVIWVYIHYKNLMLEEASRRIGVNSNDLLNFGTGEILEMLEGKVVSENEIKDRRIAFASVMDVLKKPVIVDSKTALKYWDLYAEDKVSEEVEEVRGIVVSKTDKKVIGQIRVLLDPRESDSFKNGDILVAPMTTPEYIFAMKKASAVITDTGGLMSHAAIVSRELGIPCIVGTKIATKVLKDGMMVEVNADKGIVKILSDA